MGVTWEDGKVLIFEKEKTAKVVIFNCIRRRNKEEATCFLADYLPAALSG